MYSVALTVSAVVSSPLVAVIFQLPNAGGYRVTVPVSPVPVTVAVRAASPHTAMIVLPVGAVRTMRQKCTVAVYSPAFSVTLTSVVSLVAPSLEALRV